MTPAEREVMAELVRLHAVTLCTYCLQMYRDEPPEYLYCHGATHGKTYAAIKAARQLLGDES